MRACGSNQTRDMIATCCIAARHLKSHPISQTAPRHALFHATADDTYFTATDGNHENPAPLRQQGCLAIWPNHLLTQVMSPSLASTSAVNTRRSITPPGGTSSTSSTTTLPQQSQQAAASGSPQPVTSQCGKPMAWRRHMVPHLETSAR